MKKLALATLLSLAIPAFAADAPTVPAPVQTAVRSGMQIVKSFDGPSGMTGWVLQQQQNRQYSVVFTTPDQQLLIAGAVIDAEGKNLTMEAQETHVPKPDYTAAWTRLENSAYIAEGAQGKNVKSVVYAFLDPNCVFCHWAWKAFKPYTKMGLQVRWVPVAFLDPTDSAAKAAAIMEAANPVAALELHESKYDARTHGGITGVKPKAATLTKLADNLKMMQDLGITGTPAIFYKDQETGKVRFANGMPRLPEIATMTGLPFQENNDPELQRFK